MGRSFYATLVPFSTACFVGAFMTDLAYWATASVTWETFSVWLLAVGLIVAGFAVVAGLIDMVRSRRLAGLSQPLFSVSGHVVAFGLSLINVFVHSRDGYTAVVPQGLILSALVVLVLLVTGLMGSSTAPASPVGVSMR